MTSTHIPHTGPCSLGPFYHRRIVLGVDANDDKETKWHCYQIVEIAGWNFLGETKACHEVPDSMVKTVLSTSPHYYSADVAAEELSCKQFEEAVANAKAKIQEMLEKQVADWQPTIHEQIRPTHINLACGGRLPLPLPRSLPPPPPPPSSSSSSLLPLPPPTPPIVPPPPPSSSSSTPSSSFISTIKDAVILEPGEYYLVNPLAVKNVPINGSIFVTDRRIVWFFCGSAGSGLSLVSSHTNIMLNDQQVAVRLVYQLPDGRTARTEVPFTCREDLGAFVDGVRAARQIVDACYEHTANALS
jgi:hypothetical protein